MKDMKNESLFTGYFNKIRGFTMINQEVMVGK